MGGRGRLRQRRNLVQTGNLTARHNANAERMRPAMRDTWFSLYIVPEGCSGTRGQYRPPPPPPPPPPLRRGPPPPPPPGPRPPPPGGRSWASLTRSARPPIE